MDEDRKPTETEITVIHAAEQLVGQYGADALVVATMRAAEFAAQGDVQGLAAWDAIIAVLEKIEEGGDLPASMVN